MSTILQDKWGRDVALEAGERGFVYSAQGVEVIYAQRSDDRALEHFAMVDVPSSPVVEPVPDEVTMRQARLALLGINKLDAVSAAIASMPDGLQKSAAQIEWEYSSAVKRHQPLVETLGPALGLTSAQIDALFIAASKL